MTGTRIQTTDGETTIGNGEQKTDCSQTQLTVEFINVLYKYHSIQFSIVIMSSFSLIVMS